MSCCQVLTLAITVANVTDTNLNDIASLALTRIDNFFHQNRKTEIPDLTLFSGTFWLPTVHCYDGFITNATLPDTLENVHYEKIGSKGYLDLDIKFENLDFSYERCAIKILNLSKLVTWRMRDITAGLRVSFTAENSKICSFDLESVRVRHLADIQLTPESDFIRLLGTKMIRITGRFFNRKMVEVLNENLSLSIEKIMPNICHRISRMSDTFFGDK